MFERYRNKMQYLGDNFSDRNKRILNDMMDTAFTNTTSYIQVKINDKKVDARIISDSATTTRGGNGSYKIQFRVGVYYPAGTYITIPSKNGDEYVWLIMYTDDDILFEKPIIKKCNYNLRWVNHYGDVVERLCVISDNNRLGNGDRSAAKDRLSLPWYTISLILPYDKETLNIRRGKRFLIDDMDVIGNPDAYIVSNRNIASKSFTGSSNKYDGNIELALSQHQFNPTTDNKALMIADYISNSTYDEKPKENDISNELSYICQIKYTGTADLKMSTPYKVYTADITRSDGIDEGIICKWRYELSDDIKDKLDIKIEDNKIYFKAKFNPLLINRSIKLTAYDEGGRFEDSIIFKVVSAI